MPPLLSLNETLSRLSVVHGNHFEFAPNYHQTPISDLASANSNWLGCLNWLPIQKNVLFQLANVCFFIAYTAPAGVYGALFLHAVIILGYLLYATWAWNVVCAPSIFTWAFVFVILNVGQILNMLYQMRTVRFLPDLESLYTTMFQPFQISRKQFSKITSVDYSHLVTLFNGDAYASENITRTDRLALLLRGRMRVSHESRPLHCIFAHEFLDSAEFHSAASLKMQNRYTVSIMALTECELIIWQRADIEYLMIKYPYVRTLMECLVAKDILLKLIILGNQISGWRSHQPCDLRLAQKKSFVASLHARSRSGSILSKTDSLFQEDQHQTFVNGRTEPPDDNDESIEAAEPPIRKSPLSLPCSANIELAQWYHAFLKRELVCDKTYGASFMGAPRLST